MTAHKFKQLITGMGGVWGNGFVLGPHIYLSQTQSTYAASYLPRYPEKSERDSTISVCHVNGMWYYRGPETENIPHY